MYETSSSILLTHGQHAAIVAAASAFVGPKGPDTTFYARMGCSGCSDCQEVSRDDIRAQAAEYGVCPDGISCNYTISKAVWDTELRKGGYDTESSESWDAFERAKKLPAPAPGLLDRFEASMTSLEESVIDKIAPHHPGGGILTLTGVVLAAGATRAVAATAKGVSGALKTMLSEE